VLHSSRDFLLTALISSQALSCLTIPMAGHWSDLLGRKRLYLLGALLAGAFGFVYFMLMNTAVAGRSHAALIINLMPNGLKRRA